MNAAGQQVCHFLPCPISAPMPAGHASVMTQTWSLFLSSFKRFFQWIPLDGLQDWSPACEMFNLVKAFLVEWSPPEYLLVRADCLQRPCVAADIRHEYR